MDNLRFVSHPATNVYRHKPPQLKPLHSSSSAWTSPPGCPQANSTLILGFLLSSHRKIWTIFFLPQGMPWALDILIPGIHCALCISGFPCPGGAGGQWIDPAAKHIRLSPTGPGGASLKPALWGPGHLPSGLPGLPVWCRCGWHHRGAGEVGPWAGGDLGLCYLLVTTTRTKVKRPRLEDLVSCVSSLWSLHSSVALSHCPSGWFVPLGLLLGSSVQTMFILLRRDGVQNPGFTFQRVHSSIIFLFRENSQGFFLI